MITHQNSEMASITNQQNKRGVYPVPSHTSLSELFQGIKRAQEDIRKGFDDPSQQQQQHSSSSSSSSSPPDGVIIPSETIKKQQNCEGEENGGNANKNTTTEQPPSDSMNNCNNHTPEKEEVAATTTATTIKKSVKADDSTEHSPPNSSSSSPIPMGYDIDNAFTTTSIATTSPWAAVRLTSEQYVDNHVEFDQTATMRYSSFDDTCNAKRM